MHGEDGYFDERVAARYDESDEVMVDAGVVEPVIDFLVEIAGSGRALELGMGTGRIALPLAQRGVPVHGIDLSNAMVARLRAKPGGEDVGVTIGDFSTTTVDGPMDSKRSFRLSPAKALALVLVVGLMVGISFPAWAATTTRVSVETAGGDANGISDTPAMSATGRYVAFSSWASDLVPGDGNGFTDVFLAGPL